jgi:hypothetical protein
MRHTAYARARDGADVPLNDFARVLELYSRRLFYRQHWEGVKPNATDNTPSDGASRAGDSRRDRGGDSRASRKHLADDAAGSSQTAGPPVARCFYCGGPIPDGRRGRYCSDDHRTANLRHVRSVQASRTWSRPSRRASE